MKKKIKTKTKSKTKAKIVRSSSRTSRKAKPGLTKIKVIGVGGGGGNAVTRMMAGDRMRGVEFIAVNTDVQDLNYTNAHKKLYIGRALTKGLGAGMNPEIGKQAAEENRSEIDEALDGADIVFITSGFGGGTGTGASPIIGEIAQEKGILTVGIVTKPFTFEGAQRINIAQEGLARFKEKVDALVVIPNDRIFSIIDKDTPLIKAFGSIDEVLKHGVQAIAELINIPGIINIDFSDIKTIMRDAGTTLIGIGVASGPERSIKAVNAAINSPLLEISIDGAKGVLFSVAGGRDIKMSEINEVAKAIAANLDSNAKIIFGAYHDRKMKDKYIKVTVIATGFNGFFEQNRQSMPNLFVTEDKEKHFPSIEEKPDQQEEADAKNGKNQKQPPKISSKDSKKLDSWEIPTFLRKKRR